VKPAPQRRIASKIEQPSMATVNAIVMAMNISGAGCRNGLAKIYSIQIDGV